jgi:uncharacterized protein (TIGR02594 family)
MINLTRRRLSVLLAASASIPFAWPARSDEADQVVGKDVPFAELKNPPFDALDAAELFGSHPPTDEQRKKAAKIIDETPKGPTPYSVARSFVDRFAKTDPDAISQWPEPQAWNPVVKEFFDATTLRVNNDMIDWCAAFVNWCIVRNNKKGTDSAASQSFLEPGRYRKTQSPNEGNLVVFTWYNKQTGKSGGIGHVAFFKEFVGSEQIRVLGGNQSGDGRSSLICEKKFLATPFEVTRHINGIAVPGIYKLNSFLVVD